MPYKREVRRKNLEKLLEKHPQGSVAWQTIMSILDINQFINDRIETTQKRLLRFDEGGMLEFYDMSDAIITRFSQPGAEPSSWIISDKAYVIQELGRVLGSKPESLDRFEKDNTYEEYETGQDPIDSFTGYYKEEGWNSRSLTIAIVSAEFVAYWVGSVGGISQRGWTQDFLRTLAEHFPDFRHV